MTGATITRLVPMLALCFASLVHASASIPRLVEPGQTSTTSTGQAKANPAALPDDAIYANFIGLATLDHNRVQREIRDAKPGSTPIVEGRVQWMAMGIRQEQFQLILDTVVVTHDLLVEKQREIRVAIQARQKRNYPNLLTAPPDPEIRRLQTEWGDIIHRMIASLKQALGDGDFDKFDTWVRLHWGNGTTLVPLSTSPA